MGQIIHDAVGNAQILTNPTVETAFSDGTNRIILGKNNKGAFDGKLVRVTLVVQVTGGTTTNFTLRLRYGSSSTSLTVFTSDLVLVATTATAVNSVTRIFFITAIVSWDSVSTRLIGHSLVYRAGTITTWATFSGTPTPSSEAAIGFITTGLFSVSNAGNTAVLTGFNLEQY